MENEGSYFEGILTTLMKQAQKYAVNVAVDAGISDWESMFLTDFMTLDEDTGALKAAWFVEKAAGDETFRTLLLGFLLSALRRHSIIVSTNSIALPPQSTTRYILK
jgi:hypothetical protein